jgi:hypothetical protein
MVANAQEWGMTAPRERPRRRFLVGLAPLALVVAIAFSQVDHSPRRLVAMPGTDASPAEVVDAYVSALDAHDYRTAGRLLRADVRSRLEHPWFDKVDRVTHLEIGTVTAERPRWSRQNRRTQVMAVPVTFEVEWRFLHRDRSLPEGHSRWTYRLSRSSDEQPWRICGEGSR